MTPSYKKHSILFVCLIILSTNIFAQSIDFSKATIINPEKKNLPLAKAVQVLREEIQKRTHILLPVAEIWLIKK